MRKSLLSIIIVVSLGVRLGAQELLSNGGFETGLDGWRNVAGGNAASLTTIATDRVRSGAQSLRVAHPAPASSAWLQIVDGLEAGALYRVSARMYRDSTTVTAGISLHTHVVSQGAPRRRVAASQPTQQTNAWERVDCQIQTTLNGQVWVHLHVQGKGTVWIDDVSVTRARTRDERQADLVRLAKSATASADERAAAHLDAGQILLWADGDAAAARRQYRQALELAAPDDARKRITALVNLAECATLLGEFVDSLQCLREVLALDPEGRADLQEMYGGRTQTIVALADVYRRQQDHGHAVATYEEVLPLVADSKAESRRLLLNIVDTCRQQKDFAGALAAARTIIEHWSAPDTPERAADLARTGDILLEEADRAGLDPAAVAEKLEAARAVFAGVRDLYAKLDPAAYAKQVREYENRVAMLRAAIEQRQRPSEAAPADNENPLITAEVVPFTNASFEENLKDWGGQAKDDYTTGWSAGFESGGIDVRSAETGAAGRKSLAVTLDRGKETYVPRSFTVKRGRKYYLSMSIKTEGDARGWFRLIRGASSEPDSRQVGPASDGWQRVGVSFVGTDRIDGIKDPQPDTSYIELRLHARGPGRVYFDDVRVYETKPYRPVLRFRLIEPAERAKLTVYAQVSYPDRFTRKEYFGEAGVFPGEYSPWIDLGADDNFRGSTWGAPPSVISAGLQFETMENKPFERIKVEVQLAAGPSEQEILKTLTEERLGHILGMYLPRSESPPDEFAARFRPLLENVRERNAQAHSLKLPPARLKRYYLLGQLGGRGAFYSDPKLLETEVNTAARIGFNALCYLAGDYRDMAAREGIRRSFTLSRQWDLPVDAAGKVSHAGGGPVILRWELIERNIARAVSNRVATLRRDDPGQVPLIELVDIGDEIGGFGFTGPEYQAEFHRFVQEQGLSPADLGKAGWEEVEPVLTDLAATNRPKDRRDIAACRHFYWSLKFWSRCTARVYRIMTAELEKHLPGVPTRVNFGQTWFNAGTDRRGTDFWEFARRRSVTAITNEDWLNTYGWRWAGIQLLAYQADLNRSAAALRGLGVGALVMPEHEEAIQLKLASAIGKGTKQVELFCYGPAFASPDNWSDSFTMVKGVARFVRKLQKVEDVLYPGQPRPAPVAIIWSQSDEIWRDSADTLFDRMFIYLALLHDQVPVDFIDEAGIEEGRLARYKVAYLCGRNLRRAAQRKLGDWVRNGGQLWLDGVAGTQDEYGQPCDLLAAVAGLERQAPVRSEQDDYRPDYGLAHQKPLDTIRMPAAAEPVAAIGTKVPVTIAPPAAAVTLSTFADGTPAVVEHRHGQGRCRYVATLAGLAYGQTAERVPGKIETGYREPHRKLITGFALEAGIDWSVTCSVPMVEADLLESDRGTGLVLANYTGQPQPQVELSVAVSAKPRIVRSAERGRIPFRYDRKTKRLAISLPLEVVDFVTVE